MRRNLIRSIIIEAELDSILPQYENNLDAQDFRARDNLYDLDTVTPERQKVLQSANNIEGQVEKLNSELIATQKSIDDIMMKDNMKAKNYGLGLALSQGAEKNESTIATPDIEKILNTYYSTLKWIQGAAVELEFQTGEIEAKINSIEK